MVIIQQTDWVILGFVKQSRFKNWHEWRLVKLLNRQIGIDLGSQTIRMWDSLDDKYIHQPACMAVDTRSGSVVAVGEEADKMVGRTAANIKIVWPVGKGVIEDLDTARVLFKWVFGQLTPGAVIFRPQVLVALPETASQADRQVIIELFSILGAKEVNTISQSLAASIGAQVPLADATGCFLLNLGDQIMEAVAISLGRVVVSQTCRQGGSKLKKKLSAAIKQGSKIDPSQTQLNQILDQVASLNPQSEQTLTIVGKDVEKTGQAREAQIKSSDLRPYLEQIIDKAVEAMQEVLAQVPAELSSDAVDKGILVTGGLAKLNGIERYLADKLRLTVMVLDEPELQVIHGVRSVLMNWQNFRDSYSEND